MFDGLLLGRGFLFGFSIAASVGPMWLLCARRTLTEGRLVGLLSGLGVATADAVYGAIAALGLTAITGLLLEHGFWLRLGGGLFLVYLGLQTMRTAPRERGSTPSGGLLTAYLSTFGLTLTNPATILAFLAIFAGLGVAQTGGTAVAAMTLVLGVFLGSAAWWLLLTGLLGGARDWLSPTLLRGLNVVSGLLIAAFGALAVLSAFQA
jgi:threonine/homoserine/homoserine lactone efflux protein